MPASARSLARRLAAERLQSSSESSREATPQPSPAAPAAQPRRVGALLGVSHAGSTGLRTALTRLDDERAAGKEALAAAKEREERLRADLASKDAVTVANEQQTAALRQALRLAQSRAPHLERARDLDRRPGASQPPPSQPSPSQPPPSRPPPSRPPPPPVPSSGAPGRRHQPPTRAALEALDVIDTLPSAPSPSPDHEPDLAEALARRRARSRALARWAKASHEAQLMLLSRRLAAHSEMSRALKAWRRTLTPVADPLSPLLRKRRERFSESELPLSPLAACLVRWRVLAQRTRQHASISARVRLGGRRRRLHRGMRAWHKRTLDVLAADRGRGVALRGAIRIGDLVSARVAMRAWWGASLAVGAAHTVQRREAQLLTAMRESDSAWRARFERVEKAAAEEAASAACDLAEERARREEEAALLHAEITEERQALLEALNAQRAAEADAAAAHEAGARAQTEVAAGAHDLALMQAREAAKGEALEEAAAATRAALDEASATARVDVFILTAVIHEADNATAAESAAARVALTAVAAQEVGAEHAAAEAAAETAALRASLQQADASLRAAEVAMAERLAEGAALDRAAANADEAASMLRARCADAESRCVAAEEAARRDAAACRAREQAAEVGAAAVLAEVRQLEEVSSVQQEQLESQRFVYESAMNTAAESHRHDVESLEAAVGDARRECEQLSGALQGERQRVVELEAAADSLGASGAAEMEREVEEARADAARLAAGRVAALAAESEATRIAQVEAVQAAQKAAVEAEARAARREDELSAAVERAQSAHEQLAREAAAAAERAAEREAELSTAVDAAAEGGRMSVQAAVDAAVSAVWTEAASKIAAAASADSITAATHSTSLAAEVSNLEGRLVEAVAEARETSSQRSALGVELDCVEGELAKAR